MPKELVRALYPGSFDPFTIGHLSVLEKAVKLFDKVYVVISKNPQKTRRYDLSRTAYSIIKFLETKNFYDNKVAIKVTADSLPARIAKNLGCDYIIRGLRNNMDYDYEEGLAKFNKEIDPSIETIYFRADKDEVSSTMVYALDNALLPIDKYLPYSPDQIRPANPADPNFVESNKEVYEVLNQYKVLNMRES